MYIARDEKGNRVEIADAEKGSKYYCPFCDGQVIVRRKEINPQRAMHFAHKSKCLDSWTYEMSEWHYNWQARFPEECREVVMEHEGVKHRADVFVEAQNCVIEFQHSKISREDFEERNRFYKSCGHNIIWIFDAKGKIKSEGDSLVWKVASDLFPEMKTPPDAIFIQNIHDAFPEVLWLLNDYNEKRITPKPLYSPANIVMPEFILKEFGVITDSKIPSVSDLIVAHTQPMTNTVNHLNTSSHNGKPKEQSLHSYNVEKPYWIKPKSGNTNTRKTNTRKSKKR